MTHKTIHKAKALAMAAPLCLFAMARPAFAQTEALPHLEALAPPLSLQRAAAAADSARSSQGRGSLQGQGSLRAQGSLQAQGALRADSPFFWKAEKAKQPPLLLLGTVHNGAHLKSLACFEEIYREIGRADLVFVENRSVPMEQFVFEFQEGPFQNEEALAAFLSQIPFQEREDLLSAAKDPQAMAQKWLSRHYHYAAGGFEDLSLEAREFLIHKGALAGKNYLYYQSFLTALAAFERWERRRQAGMMDIEVLSLALSNGAEIQFLDDLRADQILKAWHKGGAELLPRAFFSPFPLMEGFPSFIGRFLLSSPAPSPSRSRGNGEGLAGDGAAKKSPAIDAAFIEDYIERNFFHRAPRSLDHLTASPNYLMISEGTGGDGGRPPAAPPAHSGQRMALRQYLVEDRNRAWFAKLKARQMSGPQRQPVFLAAGEAHFEGGLLDMLAGDGYTISRMRAKPARGSSEKADCSF